MNNIILARNSLCDSPRPGLAARRLTSTVLYHTSAKPYYALDIARPGLVVSCVHNNIRQAVIGNCVIDTDRLCTAGCLMTGGVYSVMLHHVTTSYS